MASILLSLLLSVIISVTPVSAQAFPDDTKSVYFNIIDQDIKDVFRDFSAGMDLRVDISKNLKGRVRNIVGQDTAFGFLDLISRRYDLSWFYDGQVIYIADISETRTVIFQIDRADALRLEQALARLGIADERYPLIYSDEANVARLTGPPRLIELAETTLAAINSSRDFQRQVTVRRGTTITNEMVD